MTKRSRGNHLSHTEIIALRAAIRDGATGSELMQRFNITRRTAEIHAKRMGLRLARNGARPFIQWKQPRNHLCQAAGCFEKARGREFCARHSFIAPLGDPHLMAGR